MFNLCKNNLIESIMKTTTLALIFSFMSMFLYSCDEERMISYGSLPGKAKTFIETYFPGIGAASIIKDKDDGRTEYTALLNDGTEIEFDGSGNWTSIDCMFSTMPSGIIPEAIADDIEQRYPGSTLYGAEKKTGGYVIDIHDTSQMPVSLRYSNNGQFIGIDYDR